MKLIVNGNTYSEIKNPSFAPEVALTSTTLPINSFNVDVVTADSISEGMYAELRDDLDNLWANYWIHQAYRLNANIVRVYAYSEIALMEFVNLDGVMYDEEPLGDVLDGIMLRQSGAPGVVTPISYALDEDLEAVTVTGYCPPQTARERLQWVLFSCGAYAKTCFNDQPEILPIQTQAQLVPLERTFYRPAVNVERRVTEIRVTAYTFTQGSQSATEILADDTSYIFPLPWVATEQTYTLANPEATPADGDNPIEVYELYLINQGNVSSLLNRLAARYFSRESVELDIVDNAEVVPGDKVVVYGDPEALYMGYAEATTFQFGLQARARLRVAAAEQIQGAALNVEYTYNSKVIHREQYFLPVGYPYEITTIYVDRTKAGTRRVYRPTVAEISGMMTGASTVQVPCAIALEMTKGVLSIYDVDGVTMSNEEAVIE